MVATNRLSGVAFEQRVRFICLLASIYPARQAAKWTKSQIAYPNMAGDPEIAQRALQWVQGARRQWIESTREVRWKWAILNKLLRGNSLASLSGLDIIHTPELYKALEALVPRIEERLFREYPHHFRVLPTSKMKKREAELIAAFLVHQLRAARCDRLRLASAAR